MSVFSVFYFQFGCKLGDALRCWLCTSDAAPFCSDPFNSSTQLAPRYALVECDTKSSAYGQGYLAPNIRPVCQKQIRMVRDQRIVTRRCVHDSREERTNECLKESTASYITTEYCENCDTDGCNSAPGVYASAATFGAIIVSAIFAKLLA